jgi:hypothetical protein
VNGVETNLDARVGLWDIVIARFLRVVLGLVSLLLLQLPYKQQHSKSTS